MFRVSKVGNKYLAVEFESILTEARKIEVLVNTGNIVCIVDELEDFEDMFATDVGLLP